MITVIDYDAGNIKSVIKAFDHLGEDVRMSRNHKEIEAANKIVLPGVGAFGDCMEKLEKYDLIEPIKKAVSSGKPFLGICLGLQLLFESSDEATGAKGLCILQGKIKRIPAEGGIKIPHMGWNSIEIREGSRLFGGIKSGEFMYFVHSYYLEAENREDVCARTFYGTNIDAAVEHENIFACQFHPEKSGDAGLKVLKNYIDL